MVESFKRDTTLTLAGAPVHAVAFGIAGGICAVIPRFTVHADFKAGLHTRQASACDAVSRRVTFESDQNFRKRTPRDTKSRHMQDCDFDACR